MDGDLLYDSIERLVRDTFSPEAVRAGCAGRWLGDAWKAMESTGLMLAFAPEERGGFGMEVSEVADIFRLVGYWAIPLPLGEAMLATGILTRAMIDVPAGIITLAPPRRAQVQIARKERGWDVSGKATRVPWGRHATTIILAAQADDGMRIVALPKDACRIVEGSNLAGEPRDDLTFECEIDDRYVGEANAFDELQFHAAGAAIRTLMMAGAANRVMDIAVAYTREHKQFGRPISAFQAVQQNLAVIGGQAAVCRASANMAAQSIFRTGGVPAIAMAKACAGEAASDAAHLGHQVHGAIGFTEEYDLHLYTRRIWAWREEFGNEAEWSELVGGAVLEDAAGPWAFITSNSASL